jgi:hypothetical protein
VLNKKAIRHLANPLEPFGGRTTVEVGSSVAGSRARIDVTIATAGRLNYAARSDFSSERF